MKKGTKQLLWWSAIGGALGFTIYSLALTGKAAKAVAADAAVASSAKAQGNYFTF